MGHRSPGRPGEKGRQFPQFLGIIDIISLEAAVFFGMGEIIRPLSDLLPIGGGLRFRVGQGLGVGGVAVLLEQTLHCDLDRIPLRGAEVGQRTAVNLLGFRLSGLQGQGVQVSGREIRPQIGPVPPNGAVFHEGVLQKDLLPCQDILPGEDCFTPGIDHPERNGWGVSVSPYGDKDQNGKPDEDGADDPYFPPRREFLAGLRCGRHRECPPNLRLRGSNFFQKKWPELQCSEKEHQDGGGG